MRKRNNPVRLALLLALAGMASACSEFLPEELDSFDKDVAFSQTLYRPTLGRTTVFSNNFNAGNSTRPLTFTILDVRHADGTPAPELTEYYPVQVWQTPYLGTERSVAEIEAKRTTENRPLLQIRQHSGEIVVRSEARSEFVRVDPDEGYEFDVRAENSGGFKDFAGLRLIPTRENDYEPVTRDAATGFITEDFIHPSTVRNMYREGFTGFFGQLAADDINVYFHRSEADVDSVPTLTFRFLDKDYRPIAPRLFAGTDWANLVHGFNMTMNDELVRYQVAYPIPLITLPTRFTDAKGERAHVVFAYDRIVRNGQRLTASMALDFSIYTPGHWEILFVFTGGTPEFKDNE